MIIRCGKNFTYFKAVFSSAYTILNSHKNCHRKENPNYPKFFRPSLQKVVLNPLFLLIYDHPFSDRGMSVTGQLIHLFSTDNSSAAKNLLRNKLIFCKLHMQKYLSLYHKHRNSCKKIFLHLKDDSLLIETES